VLEGGKIKSKVRELKEKELENKSQDK